MLVDLLKVSILNGIVMGGGAGASIHGRFRVATENSVIIFLITSVLKHYGILFTLPYFKVHLPLTLRSGAAQLFSDLIYHEDLNMCL